MRWFWHTHARAKIRIGWTMLCMKSLCSNTIHINSKLLDIICWIGWSPKRRFPRRPASFKLSRTLSEVFSLIKICLTCGKEFQVAQWQINAGKGKYCSKSCANQRSTKIKKTCALCGREFLIFPSEATKKYCSIECYNKSKKRGWKSELQRRKSKN